MAANPAMIVRIAADLETLKKNLAEGKIQVEALTAGMQKMVASFQGDKLIQHAHNMVAAVREVGGVTKLTEAEMARVHATVTKALEKYRVLGREAPAAMIALAKETAVVEQRTSILTATFGKFAGLITAAAVTRAAKESINYASAINDLSLKTSIGTTELQRLKFAAEQNGATLDQVADSVAQLSKRLGGGGDSVVSAVQALGLSFNQLRQTSPGQAFETIADALMKIENPMRQMKIGTDLFGKSFADLLPMMKSGVKELGDEAEKLGLVLSKEMVKGGDDAGDSIDKLLNVGKSLLNSVIGPMLPGITELADGFAKLANVVATVVGALSSAGTAVKSFFANAAFGFDRVREAYNLLFDEIDKPEVKAPEILTTVPIAAGDAVAALRDVDAAFGKNNESIRASIKAKEDAARAAEAHTEKIRTMVAAYTGATAIQAANDALESIAKAMQQGTSLQQMTSQQQDAINAAMASAIDVYQRHGQAAPAAMLAVEAATRRVLVATQSYAGVMNLMPGVTGKLTLESRNLSFAIMDNEDAMRRATVELANRDAALKKTMATQETWRDSLYQVTGAINTVLSGIQGKVSETIQLVARGVENVVKNLEEGDLLGAVVSGITAAVGVIGKLFGFGMSQGRKELIAANAEIQKMKTNFADAHGGLARLVQLGTVFGKNVMAEWGNQGKAGQEALSKFFKGIEADINRLQSAMDQYGISWDQLGEKAKALQFADMVKEAVADFEILTRVGTDNTLVLQKMAGTFNQLIAAGLRAGQTLPPELLKIAKQMARLGLLSDEATRAILGLAQKTTVDFKAMEEAAKRYGIQLSDLGSAFQQAKLDDAFGQILKDFELLSKGGANVGAVLGGMQEEIQALVTDAMKFGAAIPDAMKPLIQAMIEAGQLVDENGEKLTDIGQLNWADPVTASLDDVVAKLDEMIQAFTTAFGQDAPDATGEAASGVGRVDSSLGDVTNNLNAQKGVWDSWAQNAINNARQVENALNNVNFGRSPGGLKEGPILLEKWIQKAQEWREKMTQETAAAEAWVNSLNAEMIETIQLLLDSGRSATDLAKAFKTTEAAIHLLIERQEELKKAAEDARRAMEEEARTTEKHIASLIDQSRSLSDEIAQMLAPDEFERQRVEIAQWARDQIEAAQANTNASAEQIAATVALIHQLEALKLAEVAASDAAAVLASEEEKAAKEAEKLAAELEKIAQAQAGLIDLAHGYTDELASLSVDGYARQRVELQQWYRDQMSAIDALNEAGDATDAQALAARQALDDLFALKLAQIDGAEAAEEFAKQQEAIARAAEDAARALEEQQRAQESLAEIVMRAQDEIELIGKEGLEAQLIALAHQQRDELAVVEALRPTLGNAAVDSAITLILDKFFRLREQAEKDAAGSITFLHSGTAGLLDDEVPAILQRGEAVLNRRAAEMVGPATIAGLNRGESAATVPAASNENLEREFRALRAELRREIPRAIGVAVSDAVVLHGRRR